MYVGYTCVLPNVFTRTSPTQIAELLPEKKLLKCPLPTKISGLDSSSLLFFFSTPPNQTITEHTYQDTRHRHTSRCVKQRDFPSFHTFPELPVATDKIQSTRNNNFFPTQPFTSALPSQVELNSNEAIHSSQASSHNTVTIPQQDLTVFNTDSNQSSWLPSSSSSLPASSAHQSNNFAQPHQQDFVLFDQPEPQRTTVNRTVSSPAPAAAAFGSLDNNHNDNRHRRSSHNQSDSASPSLQNQRVAQIIQATGHQISSSAFTNRFNSPAQNQSQQQFYASYSSPSSTAAVNQQNRPPRPPVPLFTEGLGNQQLANKMDLHGNYTSPSSSNSPGSSQEIDALNLEDFPPLEGGASTTAYSSPGIPAYDMNVSSASSNLGTVSPQDLLRDFASAPNSTAFTNLTSPSIYNESPDFTDSLDVSPAFDTADFGGNAADPWFPLFPQENTTTTIAGLDQSPSMEMEELDVVEKAPRRKSSNSPSSTGHARHSSVSGVNSRRRDKPLPPIVVDDPSDTIAMKRARNTLAARKSRERKAQRMEEYEEKITKLTQERDHWKRIALGRNGGATG